VAFFQHEKAKEFKKQALGYNLLFTLSVLLFVFAAFEAIGQP